MKTKLERFSNEDCSCCSAESRQTGKVQKKLDTFLRSFRNRILNEILLYLSDAGGLTEDASLTFRPDDPLDRARLRNIKERINRLVLRDPDRFRRNVDDFIARNMGNWIRTADRETRQIAEWYVKNLAADVSTAQRHRSRRRAFLIPFLLMR